MLTAPRLHSPATSRYGGMYVMGMAYRGTANNGVVQRLLHFAVSDVSDDVRRAAVLNIGFLLVASPAQCPPIVALLSESYNPHVRYGALRPTYLCYLAECNAAALCRAAASETSSLLLCI